MYIYITIKVKYFYYTQVVILHSWTYDMFWSNQVDYYYMRREMVTIRDQMTCFGNFIKNFEL